MSYFESLRNGERQLLLKKLIEHMAASILTADVPDTPASTPDAVILEQKARRLERAIYNQSVRNSVSIQGNGIQDIYISIYQYVDEYLSNTQESMDKLISGDMKPEKIIAEAIIDKVYSPREEIQKMFVRSLLKAPEFANKTKLVNDIAKKIEVSCYNASVKISKDSEDPPRRQWDSVSFVDIYSTRCGTINNLLDSDLKSCKIYGNDLITKLHDGIINPEHLGDMSAADICPAALAIERTEISKRNEQKIIYKTSKLFKCCHCGARECTYKEVQRRALDESPDYICVCLKCNRNFIGRS